MPFFEALSLEARRVVPSALAASAALAVPVGFCCGLFGGWLTGKAFVSPFPETPWTERARAALGARTGLRFVGPYASLVVGFFTYVFAFFVGDTSRWLVAIAAGLACYLGVDVVRLRVERAAHRAAIPARGWWALKALWFLLAAPQLVVVIVAGLWMPPRFDRDAVLIGALALALVVAIGTGSLWRILRACGLIRPATPALLAAIDEAQKRTGVTAAGTWILPTWGVPFCNAFALPVLRRIAFTSDALTTLTHDEIVAVASHELGHVAETRTVAWLRTLRGSAFLPLALARPLEASFGAAGILGAIFAMLAIAMVFQRMSRALEVSADKVAHGHGDQHAHEDSATYARALEKVYARNLVPAVMPGKRTHPDLYDRMIAAGVQPEYPRPAKPKLKARVVLAAVAAVLVALVLTGIGVPLRTHVRHSVVEGLGREADLRLAGHDAEGALSLTIESLQLANDPRTLARYARANAGLGECEEARDAAAEARSLPGATEPEAAALLAQADQAIGVCAR